MKKYIIWTWDVDIKDWRDDLKEYYPDADEAELVDRMYEINDDYLDDEKANLNIPTSGRIIMIASLGLWDGRHQGYRILERNINECLSCFEDRPTWYVDEHGDLRCDDVHHDGTNHYLFREERLDVDIDELLDKLYEGSATDEDIEHYTKTLGDRIGKVYGWEVA